VAEEKHVFVHSEAEREVESIQDFRFHQKGAAAGNRDGTDAIYWI
jgi:hypothetical protein